MMLSDSIVVCSGSLGVKNSQESEGRNKEENARSRVVLSGCWRQRDKNKSEFRANARCGWRICACPHTAARRQAKGAIARRRRVWSSINLFTPARLKPLLPVQFRSSSLANKVIRPHSLHECPSFENLMHPLSSQNHFLQSHVQILDNLPHILRQIISARLFNRH
jgi:hypothetical protein